MGISQQEMTLQVRRVRQLELILNHWLKNIECLIEKKVNKQVDIADFGCHFDKWIRRLRDDLIFDEAWLNEMELAYNEMHIVSRKILMDNQVGSSLFKKDELNQLYNAFKHTLHILSLVKVIKEQQPIVARRA